MPFDFECATGIDFGEGADGSVVRFDAAISSNANPAAAGGESDAEGQKYNRDLLHVNVVSLITMH